MKKSNVKLLLVGACVLGALGMAGCGKKNYDTLFFKAEDFYENEELIAITKELADTLRKNRTIDWQKRDSARARMRMMIKRLLKKHRYPPEGMDDAVQTVMTQCELWTDNNDMELPQKSSNVYTYSLKPELSKVAEEPVPYGKQ